VKVPESSQAPARGSALFGAVAAGAYLGGFATISDAARALQPKVKQVYTPDPTATTTYGAVYKIWKDLHDTLGRTQAQWLHDLKRQKRLAANSQGTDARRA
jgi:L-ribulokinase